MSVPEAHGDDHGKKPNGYLLLAGGLLAVAGAAMLAMSFLGVGVEDLAKAWSRATVALAQTGNSIAAAGAGVSVFFTMNRDMINLAIGMLAFIAALFAFKKLA